MGAVVYGIAAALAAAGIAAYKWHQARRALLGVHAARRLDQAVMAREIAAIRQERERAAAAGGRVDELVVAEAISVIDAALSGAQHDEGGGRDA